MLPALERRPATEAVARMEPEGWGLDGEGRRMAAEACLVARKTLRRVRAVSVFIYVGRKLTVVGGLVDI